MLVEKSYNLMIVFPINFRAKYVNTTIYFSLHEKAVGNIGNLGRDLDIFTVTDRSQIQVGPVRPSADQCYAQWRPV